MLRYALMNTRDVQITLNIKNLLSLLYEIKNTVCVDIIEYQDGVESMTMAPGLIQSPFTICSCPTAGPRCYQLDDRGAPQPDTDRMLFKSDIT